MKIFTCMAILFGVWLLITCKYLIVLFTVFFQNMYIFLMFYYVHEFSILQISLQRQAPHSPLQQYHAHFLLYKSPLFPQLVPSRCPPCTPSQYPPLHIIPPTSQTYKIHQHPPCFTLSLPPSVIQVRDIDFSKMLLYLSLSPFFQHLVLLSSLLLQSSHLLLRWSPLLSSPLSLSSLLQQLPFPQLQLKNQTNRTLQNQLLLVRRA